jgi:hypothetical protein
MAKTLVQVNTDTALDLSNEIEQSNSRFNNFINSLQSEDREYHLKEISSIKRESRIAYDLELGVINEQKQIDQPEPSVEEPPLAQPKAEPVAPKKEEPNIFEQMATAAAGTAVVGAGAAVVGTASGDSFSGGGKPQGLALTGENGRMKPDQLVSVGTLSGSPSGGPYWYGRNAYLRKSDAGPAFLRAKQDASKAGITVIINSAYRSIEHQKALQGQYAVVAAPGPSPHGDGIALDIERGPGWDWMAKNGPKYGWKWMQIPNDDVHFEYVGGGQSTAEPPKPITPPTPPPTPTPKPQPQVQAQQNTQPQSTQVASSPSSGVLNTNSSGLTREQLFFATV